MWKVSPLIFDLNIFEMTIHHFIMQPRQYIYDFNRNIFFFKNLQIPKNSVSCCSIRSIVIKNEINHNLYFFVNAL